MRRIREIFCALGCLLLVPVCGAGELVGIHVDGIPARVEVAASDDARRRGLMNRTSLAQDQGLLMVFPEERLARIWMLNVQIPLDVGFFDSTGVLLNSLSMQPDGGRQIHHSSGPARYALEMNLGWFERHGLVPGARLELPVAIKGR